MINAGLKPAIANVLRWWYATPPELTSAERRFHSAAAAGYPQGWAIHLLFIFLFLYWNVPALAIANVFSVILWTAAIIFWRYRYQHLSIVTVAFEVIIHAALSVQYLGWGSGMQYYLFTLLLAGSLIHWPRRISLSFTVLLATLFILFYYYAQFNPPLAAVDPFQLGLLNSVNIISTFGICAVTTLYFIAVADKAEAALEVEHAKSEALLHNVLPTVIAARLKQQPATIADGFNHASILFADIVGFTVLSQQIPPDRVVQMLNDIFSRFDELVDRYGLEKIKTVGDAYMAAAGIPTPRVDHAERLADFALAMRDVLADYNRSVGTNLQLRIGLNSGPVVAGVIGRRRFLYDLWGDSVNTASRMESHGLPGEIQVTDSTYRLLREKYSFVERGEIEVKGKGPMRTYFLRGRQVRAGAVMPQ